MGQGNLHRRYQINVQNEHAHAANTRLLERAAEDVLDAHLLEDAALTIVITNDEAVRALNQQFRGIDAPTDVLSFPADAPPYDDPDEPRYLGDLVIAYPYASSQAAREHHTLDDSLSLLVVHGVLHLLGYDHGDTAARARMWEAQAQALTRLGISPALVPQLEESRHNDETDET